MTWRLIPSALLGFRPFEKAEGLAQILRGLVTLGLTFPIVYIVMVSIGVLAR